MGALPGRADLRSGRACKHIRPYNHIGHTTYRAQELVTCPCCCCRVRPAGRADLRSGRACKHIRPYNHIGHTTYRAQELVTCPCCCCRVRPARVSFEISSCALSRCCCLFPPSLPRPWGFLRHCHWAFVGTSCSLRTIHPKPKTEPNEL